MTEPFKLYVREKFTTGSFGGLASSPGDVAAVSQIVCFENRASADFAFGALEDCGVFVVKLYPS